MKNALITGFHRSGTTLICHLLNKLNNIVALDEPLNISAFRMASPNEVRVVLDQFFSAQRSLISDSHIATSKSQAGRVPPNQLGDLCGDNGRISVIDGTYINVVNVTSFDFDIYVKHPAVFTALLPILENYFPCYVSIRNPLAILLSWRATPFNVSKGRAPAAEMVDRDLSRRLELESDILERQLILIDFFFSRYHRSSAAKILRYEDVVSTGGRALTLLDPRAECLSEPLRSRNHLYISRDSEAIKVADKLLKADNSCWNFYTRDEVAELIGV
jgi:hypothetical protein